MRPPLMAIAMLAIAAAWLVIGSGSAVVAWTVILLVPGLAVCSLLPVSVRASTALAVVSTVIASITIWTVLVPWLALVGIPISSWSLMGAGAAVSAVGLGLSHRFSNRAAQPARSTELWDLAGLGLVIAVALLVLQPLWGDPPIGGDWGHYWAFADQIVKTGGLDATNANWMHGGAKFSDYPGFPGVLAAWLLLAGLPASATAPAVGLLFILSAVLVWMVCRAWWGSLAGVMGGVAAALSPPTIAVVGWSGLATLLALVFAIPLIGVAAYAARPTGRDRDAACVAAVLLAAATLITQPMIGELVVGALLLVGLAAALLHRVSWRAGALSLAGLAMVAGPLLLAYKSRLDSLGGLQGVNAYLPTRIDWVGVTGTGMLPVILVVGALGGLAVASYAKSSRRLAVAVLTVVAVALLYSQSWRIGVAGEYRRALYLIGPLAAVGVAGIAADGFEWAQARKVLSVVSVGVVVLLAATGSGWPQQQSDFFQVATRSNWVVAQRVGSSVRPEEAIVADPCWAFPAVGLGSSRVFGALLPHQIGPLSESVPAAQARAVFAGGRAGRSAVASLGIRWSFVDPSCPTPLRMGKQDGVPPGFIPVAVDDHLIVGYRP